MTSSILTQLATAAAPYLIVYAALAVLAAKRMQRHPGPSRLALLACVVLFAGSLTAHMIFGYFNYTTYNHPTGDNHAAPVWILRQASVVAIVSFVAGMGLMFKAVYADRDGAASRDGMPEEKGELSPPPSPLRESAAPAAPQGLSTSMNSVT